MTMDAQVIEHMMNPKNYGALPGANAEGMGKNPENGEKVAVYLRIETDEDEPYIGDIKFQAIGCTTTVVAGSMLTEEARGLNLNGAYNLVDATMKLLEKLPAEDAACSEMVALAIKAAVDTYVKRQEDPSYPVITYQVANSCVPKEENKEEGK
ncbi:nitrogen fixation protein NifU [Sulfurovum lithotrophicum]|uniref:Nitrogen fixation protein NifU n=1 Tax=Sulfurovum lithotrophicum TaxID=206403 RepID=A0A7U4RQD8_9BACT|nr:iron-sulfur cluster assembly scaffold protein [Sulfurovum lithotrophicum]AKF24778.1 nitrogen fixation protein NifU [Sulfurovum lithotrophicum]